jgi:hypothetical protein
VRRAASDDVVLPRLTRPPPAGLDAELVTSRRARLKKFYAEQNKVYQAELSAKGLSLAF